MGVTLKRLIKKGYWNLAISKSNLYNVNLQLFLSKVWHYGVNSVY
jgi:hypothetical protein